jgi:integrase
MFCVRTNERRPLKTTASAAKIAIPEPLEAVLRDWIPQCECEWLFPGTTRSGPWLSGGPGVRAYDQLVALGERAGIPDLCFSSMRHTVGTLAESWGMGELELQRLLRHTTRRTQAHYRKADLDQIRGIGRKIRYA